MSGKYIRLPRYIAIALANILDVEDKLPAPRQIGAVLEMPLFPSQEVVIDYLCSHVFNGAHQSTLLNVRAGYGKTFIAAGLIARLKLRTLYITVKRPLAEQAQMDLRKVLGDSCEIGLYKRQSGSLELWDVTSQDVTIIVINSALKCPSEFFARYSLIVFDEIHLMCSGGFGQIFWKTCARACLGMSATTNERRDGFDVVARKFMGGETRAEDIPGFSYDDVRFDIRVDLIRYDGPADKTRNLRHETTGDIFNHYMVRQLMSDQWRTQLIVDRIIDLCRWRGPAGEKHKIFAYCEECAPLAALRDLIIAETGAIVADEVTGKSTKSADIRAAIDGAQVILTTYALLGTGVSVLECTAEVFLFPRRSGMKQIVGRALRRGSNPAIPRIIVDIVDNRTALRHQVNDRMIAYDFYGAFVNETHIEWSDMRQKATSEGERDAAIDYVTA